MRAGMMLGPMGITGAACFLARLDPRRRQERLALARRDEDEAVRGDDVGDHREVAQRVERGPLVQRDRDAAAAASARARRTTPSPARRCCPSPRSAIADAPSRRRRSAAGDGARRTPPAVPARWSRCATKPGRWALTACASRLRVVQHGAGHRLARAEDDDPGSARPGRGAARARADRERGGGLHAGRYLRASVKA